MARHKKTIQIIETAKEILSEHKPMTVRQVYYQLVSRQIIENNRSSYQAVSTFLVSARQEGYIQWNWIDDRLRIPRQVNMWNDLSDFAETVINAYRRNVWNTQDTFIEVWLEKDALSGIFEDVLEPYGITLNIGRGYDGWTSIYRASRRYAEWDNVVILYFGDFDPSGEDMVRSLRERLLFFQTCPEIIKVALTKDDITTYALPPDFAKKTDTRAKGFIAKHGDISVELDALPINVLKERIIYSIETYMNMESLESMRCIESKEKGIIETALKEDF